MFFRKIFGKKPAAPQIKELTLDLLDEQIKHLKEDRSAEAVEILKPKVDEIIIACEGVKIATQIISEAELTEDVHPKLYKMGNEARRLLTEKIIRAMDGVNRPRDLTWQSLLDFNDSAARAVSLVAETSAAHGRHVAILFEKQMQNLFQSIHKLHGLTIRLGELLNEKGAQLRELDRIASLIARQREFAKEVERLRVEEELLERREGVLSQTLMEGSTELERLMKCDDFKQLESLQRELLELEEGMNHLRNAFISITSGISRPFRKMRNLVSIGKHPLDRDLAKALDLYIDDPFEAALSEVDGLPMLNALLLDIQNLIQSGEVELSARERRKKLERIHELLKTTTLLGIQKEYRQLLAERESKSSAYKQSPLLRRKAELEKSIEQQKLELERVRANIGATQTKLGEIRHKIEENRAELEKSSTAVLDAQVKLVD
ncbi:MAG: hypothetical protein QMC89_03435 [Candidatus Hodarchaeaceae archaeon]|nr:hypothetical protein [Candidatus Hodarchaeaceae archaeon]